MHLDAPVVIAKVRAAVPDVVDAGIRHDSGGQSGYFVCTLRGRMRVVPWRRQDTAWSGVRSDAQIAEHIAKELMG